MNNLNTKKIALSLVILFVLITPFVIYESSLFSTNNINSIELGISSVSPSGDSGGSVIPASCGSPHSSDLCTPPSFSGSNLVNSGSSATLSWTCVSSSSSAGVNFSTGGATSGSVDVTPTSDTTYTIICSNGGQGSITMTVLNPELSISATPALLQSGSTSSVTWTATSVNSCSVSENSLLITDSWSGTSGTQTTSPIVEETIYTLTCITDAGSVSQNVTIKLVPVFQEF